MKKKGVKGKKPHDKGTTNASNKMAFSAPMKGIRVRLWNLPNKKNIHRDLKSAFEGFRGILDINPAVSGTKKTRDPVCKGFAFVDLATHEAATRFVETYSTRSISFGRVEKRIGCCIVNPSAYTTNTSPNANTLVKLQKGEMLEPQLHDGFMGISENKKPSDESPFFFVEEDEEEEDASSSLEILESYDDEADEDNSDQEITKLTSGERKKVVDLKRRRVRPRKANSSRLSLPSRLKGRERDVLTGIFSKYSPKSGPAPTTES